jgi:hypothetical protein
MKKSRKIWSIKHELLCKSREAMLCAVSIFNNPSIIFKSESFVVLSTISWTYLLHAFYRDIKVDYRYYKQSEKKKKYDRTSRGAYKYWELERCLKDQKSPIDKVTTANLLFLIGLRHEIEHQMTTRIDDFLSARFQACCLNYNSYVKELFGNEHSIDKYLSFSLQFSSIDVEHINQLQSFNDLPKNIATYINSFDSSIDESDFNDSKYSYRVFFVPKSVNHKGKADRVIEFVPANSPEAVGLNKEYVLYKEREKTKLLPSDIVKRMNKKGYTKFKTHHHTDLWKEKEAKSPGKGYGTQIAKTWYWYETWLQVVEAYCKQNKDSLT